ncbi:MAG TPA: methyltransferase domain-containing protein [Chitinophagaceae bacterium]|nr:methyltransferase domain-containing protein [Chitinophagaceae bacterium]
MAYDKYQHFILEKKLANELRESDLQQRRSLYMRVYNDLFTTFPEITHNVDASVEQRLGWQLKFLKRLFDKEKVFMEIGSGDCLLAKELTNHFKKVVAFEVADAIPFVKGTPDNFELKIFNGFDMKEEPSSYDIIYSNQVFEHLHPDDTIPLLRSYHKFLKDAGKLVIVTPNKLTGPHDVSREFCEDAEGFHLKEYTYKELKALLKATGYKKLRGYIGHKKLGYFALNISLLVFAEKVYNTFPGFLKRRVKHSTVLFNLFGLKITAVKK